MQKSRAEKAIAVGKPSDIHQIVHTASHHRVDRSSTRMAAIQVGRLALPILARKDLVRLLRKSCFRPIDPTVGTKPWTVQVVGTARKGCSIKPNFPFLADSISIGVGEFPDLRWSGNVNIPADAQDSFGETQFVGHHLSLVEFAIVVRVSKPYDAMGTGKKLLLDSFFGLDVPNRFGHDDRSIRGECGGDRPSTEIFGGDFFDRTKLRDGPLDRIELNFFRRPFWAQSVLRLDR
jgi:hypothetical protein